jgi:hypothetical protein
MRFVDVGWREEFDGIWACASLLHTPAADFPGVAARLAAALRIGGAWYMSFKLGHGERVAGGRRFTDRTEDTLRSALAGTGVELVEARVGRVPSRGVGALLLGGLGPPCQTATADMLTGAVSLSGPMVSSVM